MASLIALVSVISLSLGIIIGEKFSYGSEVAVTSLLIFVIQTILYFLAKRREEAQLVLLKVLIVASFFILVGIVRVQISSTQVVFVCESACKITGEIASEPESRDLYQEIDLKIEGSDYMLVRVRAPLYPRYEIGDMLTIEGKVGLPKRSYPHEGEKEFDYISYLKGKDVGSVSFFPKISKNEGVEKSAIQKLRVLRSSFIKNISLYVSSPESSLASGMLLGESNMSSEMKDLFRRSGLSHIVVLSGFNIAIIISFVLFVLRVTPLFFRVMASGIFVSIFVIMVGAESSIIRATCMAFISLLALSLGRGYVASQALLISFLGILLYKPESLLLDVSLHLSFLATAGIIYLPDAFERVLYKLPRSSSKEILITTASAFIATLPYIAHTFGNVSLYGIIVNIIVLPFVPLIMLLTFVTLVFSFFLSVPALVFGYLVSLLTSLVITIAELFSGLPFSYLEVSLSLSATIFIYVAIIFGVVFFGKKKEDETQETKSGEIISGVISY